MPCLLQLLLTAVLPNQMTCNMQAYILHLIQALRTASRSRSSWRCVLMRCLAHQTAAPAPIARQAMLAATTMPMNMRASTMGSLQQIAVFVSGAKLGSRGVPPEPQRGPFPSRTLLPHRPHLLAHGELSALTGGPCAETLSPALLMAVTTGK